MCSLSGVVEMVQYSLQSHLTRNALFLCERMYAHHPSPDALYLLATCHYLRDHVMRAYLLLSASPLVLSTEKLRCCGGRGGREIGEEGWEERKKREREEDVREKGGRGKGN